MALRHQRPLIVVLFLLISGACSAAAQEITVSAASSLTDAFRVIARAFEKGHPGTKVVLNFASSGALASQIEQGAPVDVFASASREDLDRLARLSLIVPPSRRSFAGNSIVVAVPEGEKRAVKNLADLKKAGVKRIAVGDPATTPGGRYALQSLRSAGLDQAVKDKLVYGNDIRQVRAYALQGEVDAAIVFATDARVKGLRIACTIPDSSHEKIAYAAAVIKGSKQERTAGGFVRFLASPSAQEALRKCGFKTPAERGRP